MHGDWCRSSAAAAHLGLIDETAIRLVVRERRVCVETLHSETLEEDVAFLPRGNRPSARGLDLSASPGGGEGAERFVHTTGF